MEGAFDITSHMDFKKQCQKSLLKKPSEKSWGISQFEQQPAKNNDRVGNGTLSFKRTRV